MLTAARPYPMMGLRQHPETEGSQMATATSKAILFVTAKVDRKVHTHPVAVFANGVDAKTYATFLRLAHRSGDVEALKKLDEQVTLTEDGAIVPDTKWSIVTVPYAPSPEWDDDETETATPAST